MRDSKLYINALNVHQGGGKTLLQSLLNALTRVSVPYKLLIDSRFDADEVMIPHDAVKVKPTIRGRLSAYIWLRKNTGCQDVVLNVGNLPPLFKLKAKSLVFLQNRYLVDDIDLTSFGFRGRLKICIERIWFRLFISNADMFIVQTPTMKRILSKKLLKHPPVLVAPYVADPTGFSRKCNFESWEVESNTFLYVASGEPHKNHKNLLYAWKLLAEEGVFPKLILTLDNDFHRDLISWVQNIADNYQLKVENLGSLSKKQLDNIYESSSALIYPSKLESFGLPLVEARQKSLPVIAGELDYVRDILDPEEVFNPESPISIARAVKRFMGLGEEALPLMSADNFVISILR